MRTLLRLMLLVAALAILSPVADAQLMITNFGEGGFGGGGGPPPACSNALDFTKACNSQYIGVIQ